MMNKDTFAAFINAGLDIGFTAEQLYDILSTYKRPELIAYSLYDLAGKPSPIMFTYQLLKVGVTQKNLHSIRWLKNVFSIPIRDAKDIIDNMKSFVSSRMITAQLHEELKSYGYGLSWQ